MSLDKELMEKFTRHSNRKINKKLKFMLVKSLKKKNSIIYVKRKLIDRNVQQIICKVVELKA